MPPSIANLLRFVPTSKSLSRRIRKFLKKGRRTRATPIVADPLFNLNSICIPFFLFLCLGASVRYDYLRDVDIKCKSASGTEFSYEKNQQLRQTPKDIEDYCWNHFTYLHERALDPGMRNTVPYPGVTGEDYTDETMHVRYYSHFWMILIPIMFISYIPNLIWPKLGIEITSKVIGTEEVDEDTDVTDWQVERFIRTIHLNTKLGNTYGWAKIMSLLTPVFVLAYFSYFVDPAYLQYGYQVMRFVDTGGWPHPMDALFPKMAKCTYRKFGFGGDVESISALCELPMNSLTQYSLLFMWWCCIVLIPFNCYSLIKLLLFMSFRCVRGWTFRQTAYWVCRDDIESGRNFSLFKGKLDFLIPKRYKQQVMLQESLDFGDWVLLDIIKQNMDEVEFGAFLQTLLRTENAAISLQPKPSVVIQLPEEQTGGCSLGKRKPLLLLGLGLFILLILLTFLTIGIIFIVTTDNVPETPSSCPAPFPTVKDDASGIVRYCQSCFNVTECLNCCDKFLKPIHAGQSLSCAACGISC